MRTFTILEELLPKLESRVATVRKKISKYSNNLLYYSYSEPRFVEDANSSFYRHFVVDVTIEGIYRIDDWDFVGICEYHSEIDKNIRFAFSCAFPCNFIKLCEYGSIRIK